MLPQKTPKNQLIFECKNCDFISSNKKDYNKHLLTNKHKNQKIQQNTTKNPLLCDCGKSYKHRASLYNHKKKCETKKNDDTQNNQMKVDNKNLLEIKNLVKSMTNAKDTLEDKYNSVKEENRALVDKLVSIAEQPKTINNTKMTIKMYLDDKCNKAVNFNEFIENIELTMNDLMYTKDHGLSKGITNILINELKDMEQTERPIHCTDKKRLQFYIKDGDWKKNDIEDKMNDAVYNVSQKHFKKIVEWDNEHPYWKENDTESDEYMKMIQQCANPKTESERNFKHVMKNLSDTVSIQSKPDTFKE